MEKATKLNLVDESEVPGRTGKRSEEWLRLFQKIPQGKALVLKQEELDVKTITVAYLVGRFKRTGALPSSYRAIRRKIKGKDTVYIVNSTEGTEEQIEKQTS